MTTTLSCVTSSGCYFCNKPVSALRGPELLARCKQLIAERRAAEEQGLYPLLMIQKMKLLNAEGMKQLKKYIRAQIDDTIPMPPPPAVVKHALQMLDDFEHLRLRPPNEWLDRYEEIVKSL